jgi:hypothetical protein
MQTAFRVFGRGILAALFYNSFNVAIRKPNFVNANETGQMNRSMYNSDVSSYKPLGAGFGTLGAGTRALKF